MYRRSKIVAVLLALALMGVCSAAMAEVSCESEKGSCVLNASGYRCECADGSASAVSVLSDGDGSLPDGDAVHPNQEDCETQLLQECPNDPPDPEVDCSDDQHELCVELEQVFFACFEEERSDNPNIQIVKCCKDYDEYETSMRWLLACLNENECDQWVDRCYDQVTVSCDGDGCPDGPVDPGLTLSYKTADEMNGFEQVMEEDDEGCQSGGTASGLALILLLLAVVFRRRLVVSRTR